MRAATGSRSSSSTGPGSDLPLSVEVNGRAIRVLLAKNAAGALASTAAQVSAAIETGSQGLIDRAHPYRTNAGTGIVQPTTAPIVLTDFLDQKRAGAPAGEVPRGPFTVRALRIGKFRDGSKPGVLIQANDHAREWVPITITMEVAERLVRNYAAGPGDQEDRRQHRHLPDPVQQPGRGELQLLQLRLPAPEHDQPLPGRERRSGAAATPGAWTSTATTPSRPASTATTARRRVCIDDTFQGPAELSEPESKNIIWLVQNNRNIKFMMSVHSNGGQLFWQPGAYIANGRVTTPRPPMAHEGFYWQSANRILSQVRARAPDGRDAGERRRLGRRPLLQRRQRARGAVLQLRRLRVRLGGRRLGLQHRDRQLPGRARSSPRGSATRTSSPATARRWSTPTA